MRRDWVALALVGTLGVADAEEPSTAELLERMAAMEATIRRLETEVAELKTEKHAPPVVSRTPEVAMPRPVPGFDVRRAEPSEPRTTFRLKLAPQADVLVDSGNAGNDYEFITSSIPVSGEPGAGGGPRGNVSAKASTVALSVRQQSDFGPIDFDYRNDFFGSGSQAMVFNLKQLTAEWNGLLIGYTTTAIFDRDALPDTLDYEGPNSLLFVYNPQIRYTRTLFETGWGDISGIASLEGAPQDITGNSANAFGRNPNATANVRWAKGGSHLRAGVLLRALAAQTDGARSDALGWAVAGSGSIELFDTDAVQFWGSVGRGYADYIQDSSGLGLDAIDSGGSIQTLPAWAVGGGYLRQWNKSLSSTATVGWVSVDSGPHDELSPFVMENTLFLSANMLWQVNSSLMVGVEYLYGWKEARNGATGDVSRVQMTLRYTFDDVFDLSGLSLRRNAE